MTLSSGTKLGRYEIRSQLGAGGMGEVYLAEDTKLHRQVAIKLLPRNSSQHEQAGRRLLREAQAAARLDHPNICAVHEVTEEDGHLFIVMAYIEGETLDGRLKRKPLDVSESVSIAIQVADALAEAHRHGIIHRDIKPSNIIINSRGHAKVMDFGLAKLSGPLATEEGSNIDTEASTQVVLTSPGTIVGTVPYMSPEQVHGQELDARSDIFSLGVVVYELLTNQQPFAEKTGAATVSAILTKDPPPLARYLPSCSDELQRIVRKCLEKDREHRYQTARDLALDLGQLQRTSSTTASVAAQPISHTLYTPRRLLLAVATLAVVALVGLAVYLWANRRQSIRSIAVLPLVNLSADPETEYLSDGITDSLINRLSQLPNLKVMSQSAVAHYKTRQADPKTIGSELGVEAVLTGKLTKRNDALTISLELTNARDNSHIWGEQYDRKLSDLLVLQREIPLDVSDKLRLRLTSDSKERLTRAYTENAEAYQLYLKGRVAWEKWSLDGAKQAVGFFEEAIRKDPHYALAYAGLADVYLWGRFAGIGLPQKEAHRRGREAATKALSIDPQLAEAHGALSQVLLYDDWDFSGAERELKRALELNPNYAEGHHAYSHLLLLLGRIDESLVESQRLLDVDPVSEVPIGHLCYHYLYARRYDDAIPQCRKDIELYPDTPQGYTLADAYYHKGMFHQAIEAFATAFAQDGVRPDEINHYKEAFARSGMDGFYRYWLEQTKLLPPDEHYVEMAQLHARLGEKDQAFQLLEKAYAEHSDALTRLKEELGFDNLRSDPRYGDLLRRIGLPQ